MHLVVMTTFLGLTASGIPLLFSDAPWARALATLLGGFYIAGVIHRFLGVILLSALVWHVATMLWRGLVRREPGIFWGPSSMVPQPRDFVDLYRQVKWFFGRGPRPAFEQFTYWEKFDYWAVLWGTGLMGAAGLVLWFPEAAAGILPGWMFNVALLVHGAEAALAIGFIFVVHFFNGHLRPGKYPMDLVIFTGSLSEHELRYERAAQYARLRATGELEQVIVPAPDPASIRRGYAIGAVGLTIGVGLFLMIAYAVLR
jgi:cytochrome b subunit of formate dehydrogenase